MILLCGIPSESPFSLVASALKDIRALPVVFNQRQFTDIEFDFDVMSDVITG